MTTEKFHECKPNFEASKGWQWFNTYHFIFLDEVKPLRNYSENEVIFHLEIKQRKIK